MILKTLDSHGSMPPEKFLALKLPSLQQNPKILWFMKSGVDFSLVTSSSIKNNGLSPGDEYWMGDTEQSIKKGLSFRAKLLVAGKNFVSPQPTIIDTMF